MTSKNSWVAFAGLAALLAGVAVLASSDTGSDIGFESGERDKLGLFSTLPIYWGEVGDMNDMLSGSAEPHWARAALEEDYNLIPLDALLESGDDEGALDRLERLVLAQPRALSASENIALDNWVREGGRALIFADPMLTRHSRFSIGDRRRSQDVVLLSPILQRWGLELQVDDDEPLGERAIDTGTTSIPVNLPGQLVILPTATDAPANCTIQTGGLLADCVIGQGSALILADAAVLEDHSDEEDATRQTALKFLTDQAFDSK
ncbi:ABC transporter [Altererythrobacter sp. ZODW24]|uniref:Gldg family protein n=1 Tax=Altererythrobacter sp. ZODW24 TaxID=2185142 RepID=UPI000DF77690|nr:ABC transporter [Altererythrobacter sp. ZODW24]